MPDAVNAVELRPHCSICGASPQTVRRRTMKRRRFRDNSMAVDAEVLRAKHAANNIR
jgi:hypothetical protein